MDFLETETETTSLRRIFPCDWQCMLISIRVKGSRIRGRQHAGEPARECGRAREPPSHRRDAQPGDGATGLMNPARDDVICQLFLRQVCVIFAEDDAVLVAGRVLQHVVGIVSGVVGCLRWL